MKKLLYSCLLSLLILAPSLSNKGLAIPDAPTEDKSLLEIQEKITGITEEEKEVLEKLFVLTQEIEEIDRMKLLTAKEIEDINKEVAEIEKLIANETISYEKNLNLMENILKAYQRSGPGSYIELILSSDNLKTLLLRINTLSDITRNTNGLLKSLEESKTKLAKEKDKIIDKLVLVEEQQKKLKETLEKNITLKEDLEKYFESLEGERTKYEDYLGKIELYWSQLKPLFSETIGTFSNILHNTNIPSDAIKIEFAFLNVKGIIEEKVFRDIIAKQSFPTKVELEFSNNKIILMMPENHLYLSGNFKIIEGQKLLFEVDEGRFLGMPLEKSTIDDLFSEGYLELDLGEILGKNKIKSIQINEDNLELQITPVFF